VEDKHVAEMPSIAEMRVEMRVAAAGDLYEAPAKQSTRLVIDFTKNI
jgi:hypothetical protein